MERVESSILNDARARLFNCNAVVHKMERVESSILHGAVPMRQNEPKYSMSPETSPEPSCCHDTGLDHMIDNVGGMKTCTLCWQVFGPCIANGQTRSKPRMTPLDRFKRCIDNHDNKQILIRDFEPFQKLFHHHSDEKRKNLPPFKYVVYRLLNMHGLDCDAPTRVSKPNKTVCDVIIPLLRIESRMVSFEKFMFERCNCVYSPIKRDKFVAYFKAIVQDYDENISFSKILISLIPRIVKDLDLTLDSGHIIFISGHQYELLQLIRDPDLIDTRFRFMSLLPCYSKI